MKTLMAVAVFVLIASACSPQNGNSLPPAPAMPSPMSGALPPILETPTGNPAGLPTPGVPSADGAGALTPAEKAAVASLSSALSVPSDQISLLSTDSVTWPNGCLGVQRIGVMCTQNQVPGYKIVLEAGGTQYEFHTNEDGSMIAPAGGIQASASAEAQAIKHLTQAQGIDPGQISVASDADVEWPDSCLGVAEAGLACAQIVTPGHLITLEAGGLQYEYHTNRDGSEVQPASVLISFTQSGGFAGRCDQMTIYRSGEIHASSCTQTKDSSLKLIITAGDQALLESWLGKYGNFQVDLSDPKGAADGMTRLMSFQGTGNQQPSAADQQALYNWALSIYQRLEAGQ